MGDIIDDIRLLFEADTTSFAAVKNSCTSTLQGTLDLSGDVFLPDVSVLFLESHTADMEDYHDDFSFLFAEESSTVVARAHSDPQLHALHDQSFQIGVIVESSLQHLQEVSLNFEETVGFLKQVLHPSLFDLYFSSVVLEEDIFSIDTGTLGHVSETPFIIEISSPSRRRFSSVPLPLFLPKGRNIIQRSWISFFIGAFFTAWQTTFRGGGLSCLLLLLFGGGLFPHRRSCLSPFSIVLFSLFGGGFFPRGFPSFSTFMRDLHLHYVLGYLKWPSSRDPSC